MDRRCAAIASGIPDAGVSRSVRSYRWQIVRHFRALRLRRRNLLENIRQVSNASEVAGSDAQHLALLELAQAREGRGKIATFEQGGSHSAISFPQPLFTSRKLDRFSRDAIEPVGTVTTNCHRVTVERSECAPGQRKRVPIIGRARKTRTSENALRRLDRRRF